MERLTYDWAECGHPEYGSSFKVLEGGTCGDYCEEQCSEHGNCKACEIKRAIARLADYERTGLMPYEVELKLQKQGRIKSRFRERYKIHAQHIEETRHILDKLKAAAAMDELTELYSLIFGISYDAAADRLQKSLEEGGRQMQTANTMTVKDAAVEFSAAMLKALCGKPWGVSADFDCPLCGGEAKAYSSPINGRRIAKCFACHFQVTENRR